MHNTDGSGSNKTRGLTPWKPGQSGNPNGRPKLDAKVKELARTHAAKAFQKIVELMDSPQPTVALAAAQEILNRAYGKAPQSLEVSGGVGHFVVQLPTAQTSTEEWKLSFSPMKAIESK